MDGNTHPLSRDDHGDDEGIVVAKVTAMLVLSLATFILGLLPIKLAAWFRWNRTTDGGLNTSNRSQLILSLLLCFGGGALLCTTFLHMLPEVSETISDLQAQGEIVETEFHLPELIMCCGFFAMYLVEELVHLYLHGHGNSKGVSEADDVIHRSFSVRKCSVNKEDVENDREDSQKVSEDKSSLKVLHSYTNAVALSTIEEIERNGKVQENVTQDPKAVIHHHMPDFNKDDPIVTSVRGLLIVLALSVHELFEGLAVGLQTSTSYVWYMLGAVSAHKLVIAFCVGIELVSSNTKHVLTLVYISTFALVSPLGIGIGIGLSEGGEEGGHSGVANVIIQALATGTLLYVVFFEVLQRQRNSKESGLKQLLAVVAGFGLMFGLLVAGEFQIRLSGNYIYIELDFRKNFSTINVMYEMYDIEIGALQVLMVFVFEIGEEMSSPISISTNDYLWLLKKQRTCHCGIIIHYEWIFSSNFIRGEISRKDRQIRKQLTLIILYKSNAQIFKHLERKRREDQTK